jgi:hypothetical protein
MVVLARRPNALAASTKLQKYWGDIFPLRFERVFDLQRNFVALGLLVVAI